MENNPKFIDGPHALMAKLLYGSGLRLMECVRLRIKDIDLDRKRIKVLGKGDKWRSTILASPVIPLLHAHMERGKALHHANLEEGFGEVYIPSALARKYEHAARESSRQHLSTSLTCYRVTELMSTQKTL